MFFFTAIVHEFREEFQVHVSQDKANHCFHAELTGRNIQFGSWSYLSVWICVHQTAGHSSRKCHCTEKEGTVFIST